MKYYKLQYKARKGKWSDSGLHCTHYTNISEARKTKKSMRNAYGFIYRIVRVIEEVVK